MTSPAFRRKPRLPICIGLMALLLLVSTQPMVPSAEASPTYTLSSWGSCDQYNSKGTAQLYWRDYAIWDWGHTWGYIWHWNGSGWDCRNTAYGEDRGNIGYATAENNASPESGSWTETGDHEASFFSGTQPSYGNIWTCQ